MARRETIKEQKKPTLTTIKKDRTYSEFLPDWISAMETGVLNGKVFSPRTIETYHFYTKNFFKNHLTLSFQTIKTELSIIPAEHFANGKPKRAKRI